jgi:hypothetical protein
MRRRRRKNNIGRVFVLNKHPEEMDVEEEGEEKEKEENIEKKETEGTDKVNQGEVLVLNNCPARGSVLSPWTAICSGEGICCSIVPYAALPTTVGVGDAPVSKRKRAVIANLL